MPSERRKSDCTISKHQCKGLRTYGMPTVYFFLSLHVARPRVALNEVNVFIFV